MAYRSYADFLNALENAGELIRIKSPTATELEITEIADREMKKPDGGKAIYIENPPINGKISSIPLAINTMGSTKRMAMALGANSVDEVAEKLGSLVQAKPPTGLRDAMGLLSRALELRHARPKKVRSGPCKDVIHHFNSPPPQTDPWPEAPNVNQPQNISKDPPSLLELPILKDDDNRGMKGSGLLIINFNNKLIFKDLKLLVKELHPYLRNNEEVYKPKIRYL